MYEKTYQSRVLKTEKKAPVKKGKRYIFKRVLIVLIVLGVLYSIGIALRHPRLQIDTVEVSGTSVLDDQDVSLFVKSALVGKKAWLFPRTSVFLVSDKMLEAKIKSQFSRVETVVVKRTDLHTLSVSIKEFAAVYLWCVADESCYFMDKQGSVYSAAPTFSGTAYPKVFTGRPLEPLPFIGMSPSELTQIATLEQRLSEINITPTRFTNVSAKELHIEFLHNKTVALLKIDPTLDTETSLEYLFSGIRTEPLASLFHGPKHLYYIDVRFSNKVVYKFE